jgi:hypothetical protein
MEESSLNQNDLKRKRIYINDNKNYNNEECDNIKFDDKLNESESEYNILLNESPILTTSINQEFNNFFSEDDQFSDQSNNEQDFPNEAYRDFIKLVKYLCILFTLNYKY